MEQTIIEEIRRFAAESPANRFPDSTERYFDEPLVGFAAADDPLFTDYKRIIGDFHLTPRELVAAAPKGTPGSRPRSSAGSSPSRRKPGRATGRKAASPPGHGPKPEASASSSTASSGSTSSPG